MEFLICSGSHAFGKVHWVQGREVRWVFKISCFWEGSLGVYSVCFSPDGALLASGSCDKTVKLWNVYAKTVSSHSPLLTSHTFTVPSPEPDASRAPSGEKETEYTPSPCHESVFIQTPLLTFHTFNVLPTDPDARRVPSIRRGRDRMHLPTMPRQFHVLRRVDIFTRTKRQRQ